MLRRPTQCAGPESKDSAILRVCQGLQRARRCLSGTARARRGGRSADDPVAIWRSKKGERFQNHRAKFTILDTGTVSRPWIEALRVGEPLHASAPPAWRTGAYTSRLPRSRRSNIGPKRSNSLRRAAMKHLCGAHPARIVVFWLVRIATDN